MEMSQEYFEEYNRKLKLDICKLKYERYVLQIQKYDYKTYGSNHNMIKEIDYKLKLAEAGCEFCGAMFRCKRDEEINSRQY